MVINKRRDKRNGKGTYINLQFLIYMGSGIFTEDFILYKRTAIDKTSIFDFLKKNISGICPV